MKKYYIFFIIVIFFNTKSLNANKYDYKGDCVCHPIYSGLKECLDKELDEYDKKLNYLYKKLYTGVSDNKLKNTEKLWIKFKEADCDYIASEVEQGKVYVYVYKACLINRTKERINDLKRSYLFFEWIRGMP